jgi:phenylpropionate dioxygenase-like ring-hydroxylating dioxygenase large terminal subunit
MFYYTIILFIPFVLSNTIDLYQRTSFPNNWYVIGESRKFPVNSPKKITIKDIPITVWKDNQNRFAAIYDVCPHRGASLSKGRIDEQTGCVVCPYHTFKFNEKGRMIQTPGSNYTRTNNKYKLKTDVPHFNILEKGGWVYLQNHPLYDISTSPSYSDLWVEPEAFDNSFRSVFLEKRFRADARTVTENSLDILHISEIHSFGNKNKPLPISETIEKISDDHYKIIYEYEAGDMSIPKKVFGQNLLVVENEFVLPHYTVARVKFGRFINTIVTSALPINEKDTVLFVKAYRNNWVYKMPFLNDPADYITKKLMDKTLNEDRNVIESIYYKHRDGNFITKFDEFTKIYRELM